MDTSILGLIVGGVNLAFVLKLIFSDIKELRYSINQHLLWHLNGNTSQRQERRGT